jgi:hypothetical protein
MCTGNTTVYVSLFSYKQRKVHNICEGKLFRLDLHIFVLDTFKTVYRIFVHVQYIILTKQG